MQKCPEPEPEEQQTPKSSGWHVLLFVYCPLIQIFLKHIALPPKKNSIAQQIRTEAQNQTNTGLSPTPPRTNGMVLDNQFLFFFTWKGGTVTVLTPGAVMGSEWKQHLSHLAQCLMHSVCLTIYFYQNYFYYIFIQNSKLHFLTMNISKHRKMYKII